MTSDTSKGAKKPRKVSPKTFAELNGVSTMTVYRALHAGEIKGAVKFRNQWRIPVDAL